MAKKTDTPAQTAVAKPSTGVMRIPAKIGDVLVIKGKGGEFRQIRQIARLSTTTGGLMKMFGKEDGPQTYVPLAPGIAEMASKSGIRVFQPPTLTIEGKTEPNPYQDPRTGKVYCRSIAVGYTAMGQLTLTPRMIIYDPNTANLQDLIAKSNYRGQEKFFRWMPLERNEKGALVRPDGLGPTWAGYDVDGTMALWVDCSAPDVGRWMRENVNRRDKAIRTCQTFADRNAASAHPAMPPQRKFSEPTVDVECVCWFSPTDDMRIDTGRLLTIDADKLMSEYAAGSSEGKRTNVVVEAEQVVDATKVEGGDAALAAADDAATHPDEHTVEEPTGDGASGGAGDEQLPMESIEELQAKATTLLETTPKGPGRRARQAAGMKEDTDPSTVTDRDQLTKLVELLNNAK